MSQETPLKVLGVDDERDIRRWAARVLEGDGLSVRTASSGGEGLELFAAEPFDILFLDLKMPGIDGMDVLRTVKARWPGVLVVVITGFATLEAAVDAMKEGAYDFIPKPFTPDQLRITARRAVERIRLQREARRLEAESRRTLRDVATEKSRLRAIIDLMDDGVLVVNRDGEVVLANPAAVRLLGAGAPGVPLDRLAATPACRDLVACACRGEALPADAPGTELGVEGGRTLLARIQSIPGEEAGADGAIAVLTDVTEYKRLDRMKSELVAKVSHEIRSPLATIHQQLASVLYELVHGQPDDQVRVVSRARDRARGLINLVTDLLDLSRLERREGPAELAPQDPFVALVAAVDSVRPQAEERGVVLEVLAPPSPAAVRVDPRDLETVFVNLLTNAVNYTPQGGRVTVSAAVDGAGVQVSVADTGIGIAPEDLDRIFERFYRVRSEQTRRVVGTGLGLAIVKGIVDGCGGAVTVRSAPGAGSTFTVRLPACPAPQGPGRVP
jgi:signal transduction histidine kinase